MYNQCWLWLLLLVGQQALQREGGTGKVSWGRLGLILTLKEKNLDGHMKGDICR